jgi:hypothetical protein
MCRGAPSFSPQIACAKLNSLQIAPERERNGAYGGEEQPGPNGSPDWNGRIESRCRSGARTSEAGGLRRPDLSWDRCHCTTIAINSGLLKVERADPQSDHIDS